ncbi:MAG: radical SAM protein [Acidobacteriota bacterium]
MTIVKAKGKIVLFNPSAWTGVSFHKQRFLPLGLMHLAPPLERLGYAVTIINQSMERFWKRKLENVLRQETLCFGVTSMTGPQILRAVEVCRLVKKKYPDLPIVWGGIHATIKPDQVLDNPFIDIVVIGEGEETFAELVEALESGSPLRTVKGIAYKENGQHFFTEARPFIDLNQHPSPSYHLVDMDSYRYQFMGVGHIHILCSRGCIYDCAYCWDPVFFQKKCRAIEPDKVLDQMGLLVKDYGIRGFIFGDDNFFIDLDWAHTILEKIVNSELNINIGKMFIRADTLCRLDKNFLDLIVRAGATRLVIGAESGSPRILRLIKKRITKEEIIESNRKLLSYPICPHYLFMLGLPTETCEDVMQSVQLAELLMKENPSATRSFNIFSPFPGTELFELLIKSGFPEPGKLEDWAKISYRSISSETTWISPETRKLISILDHALMCNKQDGRMGKQKRDDPLPIMMSRIYGPLARYRVRTMDTRFPVELFFIKAMRRLLGRDRVRI